VKVLPILVALLLSGGVVAGESVSIGTPAKGALRNGVSMPFAGEGFVSYSRIGYLLGRQYVHSRVRDTLVAAFRRLHQAKRGRTFVLGELGKPAAPDLAPLSARFMRRPAWIRHDEHLHVDFRAQSRPSSELAR
jgi:hypothetical protein